MSPRIVILSIGALLLLQGEAMADPLSPMGLKAGYGRAAGDENRPVGGAHRDPNGNLVIVNGLLTDPAGLSGGVGYSRGGQLSGGLGDGASYAGGSISASASASGNQINVVAGSWNTIIVDAVQTNTGDVAALAGF